MGERAAAFVLDLKPPLALHRQLLGRQGHHDAAFGVLRRVARQPTQQPSPGARLQRQRAHTESVLRPSSARLNIAPHRAARVHTTPAPAPAPTHAPVSLACRRG